MTPKLIIQSSQSPTEVFPENSSVGIHGTPGCFTAESVNLLAKELKVDPQKLNLKYLIEAEKVIEAVINGEVERGAFAVANSGSGACVFTMHAMAKYQFEPVAVYGMEVVQCLLAHPSVKNINQVTEIFAHPQAIEQSIRTLHQKYPDIKITKGTDQDDTALCAKKLSTGELAPTTATIASQTAAQKYGLNILDYGVHHDPFNVTTFLVIKKK